MKTKTIFKKNWSTVLLLKLLRLKMQYFDTKLLRQKPMLRQMVWGVQNELILPVTTLFFKNFVSV